MNQEVRYKWVKQSPEWIKNNPGKPTMYKQFGKYLPDELIKREKVASAIKYMTSPPLLELPDHSGYGVYAIVCEAEKYAYVGESKNVSVRIRNHKMNIMGHTPTDSKAYTLMRDHRKKHGIEGFSFVVHTDKEFNSKSILLEAEAYLMGQYLSDGYKLYNSAISLFGAKDIMYCPKELTPLMIKLINLLSRNIISLKEMEAILNLHPD